MLKDAIEIHDAPVRPHDEGLDYARERFEYFANSAESTIAKGGNAAAQSSLALAWSIVYAARLKRESDF